MSEIQVLAETTSGTHGAGVRSRSYEWHDPALTLEQLPLRSGMDLVRAMTAGELPYPPLAATLGFERLEVLEGPQGPSVAVLLDPDEHHMNPLGSVHGGVLASMLDTACGCAVHVTLPAGTGYTSIDLSTRFLRPVVAGSGRIRAVGRVISSGRRTALAEAEITDEAGRLIAHATSTCMLFPLPGAVRSA